jgi:hypothetical protein
MEYFVFGTNLAKIHNPRTSERLFTADILKKTLTSIHLAKAFLVFNLQASRKISSQKTIQPYSWTSWTK